MDGESCVENGVKREEKAENSSSSYNRSGGCPAVNGITSNGLSSGDRKKEHSSHSGKDKHRDRDRHKEKDRHRDKEKHREKSSENRHGSSSSNSHHKEKERIKDGHSSRDKEKERTKESVDKHRERDKDGLKDKREHSSSYQKDKERSFSGSHSKDKHSSSNSSKPHSSKDKDKYFSSSSASKDKHRSSGDSTKHSSSSDKSKSSGSSKDKHKERDKEKRHKEKDKREDKLKEEKPLVVKDEPREESRSLAYNILKDDSSEGELRIKEEDDEDPDESSFNLQVDDPYRKSLVVKEEEDSEDDTPLIARKSVKRESPSDDDVPLTARKKPKKEKDLKRKKKQQSESEEDFSDEEDDYKPAKKKTPKKPVKTSKSPSKTPTQATSQESPSKRKKVKEEEQEVWKWWEEEKKSDGQKWNFLEHKGPVFAPPYERLPDNVKFQYNGKEMKLSQDAEEVATFYSKMLDHDYTTKEAFNKNFFKDWRKTMTSKEREIITDLSKCNFRPMCSYFQQKSEERKAMSKEEKKALKEKNEELIKEYGFCTIDGHKEKIGNFRIEPPSLFRGRGEHPKMGMLKKRVMPEDVIINCSKDSKWPKPPPGHKWKEVRHDNTVTWLASWTENVQGQVKYVMLNPSSKLKGEKDWQKYETARKLAHSIEKIRRDYRDDWKSKEMRIRQRAVAMYFIDKLALRAGNEKDEDQADTVGCCSLRVEHIQLFPEKDGKEYVVVFDFLGKDSIRYYNEVPVEKRVFKNLQLFMENKKGSDDLFDRLNTTILNKHLNELMDGLTAKVFRTYNASWTLQQQLEKLTDPNYTLHEMTLAYNRANRAVAILCNHQRSIPKSHQKSMENLKEKIQTKKEQIDDAERQYKVAKKEAKHGSAKESIVADKKKKALERLKEQLRKLEVQETDREENKTIALGTSKLNYLDPRISVAWCKKFNVPIEKVYNKTQRDKFRWAIDMAGPDYVF